ARTLRYRRQPEIEYLHHSLRRDHDVCRLQIAMNDALLMRRLQRLCDLPRVAERRFERNRSAQRLALDQLHHQRALLDPINLSDVGMIESGQRPGFALEARHAVSVSREALRQDFDRHIAPELGIGGSPDFAHPTLAELGGDLVVRDGGWRTHP